MGVNASLVMSPQAAKEAPQSSNSGAEGSLLTPSPPTLTGNSAQMQKLKKADLTQSTYYLATDNPTKYGFMQCINGGKSQQHPHSFSIQSSKQSNLH